MTINELIQVAHADAKANGWWDEPRNTGELLMLIVSECGEALEAHRAGKHADLKYYDQHRSVYNETPMELHFRDHIKDTFEDELADIVIRIADMAGGNDLAKTHEHWVQQSIGQILGPANSRINIGAALYDTVTTLTAFNKPLETRLFDTMFCVGYIAGAMEIDLERHIELKLAYNRTRPYKHSKLY